MVWSAGDFGGVGISEGGGVRGEDGMSSSKIALLSGEELRVSENSEAWCGRD